MLNIIRHLIYWYPICRSSLRFYQTSNSGRTFYIYFIIESHHSVLLFSLSILIASFTVFDTMIPYLCVLTPKLCVLEMLRSCFLSTYFTHYANSGSFDMRSSTENSAIWTGYEYFTSFSVFQVVLPFFHWIQIYHPFIVFTLIFVPVDVYTNASCCITCVPYVLVPVIESSIVNQFTAW